MILGKYLIFIPALELAEYYLITLCHRFPRHLVQQFVTFLLFSSRHSLAKKAQCQRSMTLLENHFRQ
ncbi:hypothetical protein LENED_011046 [Lentinula edodes]|uniref:Uncharacterized protein n=1 Tax=Lentinula edodes TaxID=5353 RepID=A0A1Q3EP01_LENED|nr:hypothetical protein LENED_011046 [Lentinula edodes]